MLFQTKLSDALGWQRSSNTDYCKLFFHVRVSLNALQYILIDYDLDFTSNIPLSMSPHR